MYAVRECTRVASNLVLATEKETRGRGSLRTMRCIRWDRLASASGTKPTRSARSGNRTDAHSALVSCQSYRRCRENESSRCTERNASCRCIDARLEPVLNEFCHRVLYILSYIRNCPVEKTDRSREAIDNRYKNQGARFLLVSAWRRKRDR